MFLSGLSEQNKILFLNLQMLLSGIDNDFADEEKKLVEAHCREMGITMDCYDPQLSINEVVQKINKEMSNKEKKIIFIELITVAFIDNVYTEQEKKFIESIMQILQIPQEVANQAVNAVKNLLESTKAVENFVEW